MGADLDTERFTSKPTQVQYDELCESRAYDRGHGGYTGTFAEARGELAFSPKTLTSESEAENWLADNCTKWEPGTAVSVIPETGPPVLARRCSVFIMSIDKTGAPAFPNRWVDGDRHVEPGITTLDWFAGKALPPIVNIAIQSGPVTVTAVAVDAYAIAAAMLAEKAKREAANE